MKKIILVFACTLFYFASQSQVITGADKSSNASVNDYKTYGWSSEIANIPSQKVFIAPNGIYVFNNESLREKIKKAIAFELSAKGYSKNESNPDMIILFRVTEQPGTLLTKNGYQQFWDEDQNGGNGLHRTKIAAGTLLINVLDNKSDKVVWQGYSSGILKPDMINDNMKVREAVSSIFRKFHFRAKQS